VLAIPAGEPLADAPAELGRRTWLSLTGSGGATAGSTHGPFTARAVGGRPGFAFTASTGGDLTEYRGAAVGTWLVLEACTRLDATAAPTVTCDALGDGLVLREAPAPPAAPAGRINGELAPYRLVRPAGFAEAPASSEEDVLATIEADEATVLVHSWENTILIAAFARDDEAAAVVDSSAYCDFLATGFPRTTHRLTPDDHAFAGRKGGGCLVEPIPGAEPATLMPDQHVRLHQLHIDRWVLQVACSSTTAQRLITDRACDQVLATMTLVAAS
jgi:hypothetical protein